MKKFSKQSMTIIVVCICILSVVGIRFLLDKSKQVEQSKIPARAKGNPQAPIRIIEYIDFECPACAKGAFYLKEAFAKNPDKFYIEVKYFPLEMHKHSHLAAKYSECIARQGKFWLFFDGLLERQAQWSVLLDAKPTFEQFANEAEVDMKKLETCLDETSVGLAIMSEKTAGKNLGIKQTPTYFINEKMVVGTKSLEEEIQKLLSDAPVQSSAND